MAGFRPDAFPSGNPWQVFRFMHPKRGLGREKRPFVATYRRRASKTSWLWQYSRAMYPKSPANRLSGMHSAQILPGRGPFRRTDPLNHAWDADLAREPPLHGPLESCIPCRSCHPSPPNSASDRKHGAALMARQPAYGRQNRARAASCRAWWRGRRSAWRCGVSSADGKAGIGEAPLVDPRHQQLRRISRAGIRGEGSGQGGGEEGRSSGPAE